MCLETAEGSIDPFVAFNQCRILKDDRAPIADEISRVDFKALDDALKPTI